MIPGSDWSMGLNSPTSVSQATVLASLGGKLRNLYTDLIAEGVPEHLAEIVSRLEPGKPASANRRGRDQSQGGECWAAGGGSASATAQGQTASEAVSGLTPSNSAMRIRP